MALVKRVKCFKIIIRYVSGHLVQSRRISQVVVGKVLVGIYYHGNRRVSTMLYYLVSKQTVTGRRMKKVFVCLKCIPAVRLRSIRHRDNLKTLINQVAHSHAVHTMSSSKKCLLGSIHSWTRLERTYAVSFGVFSGESGSGVIHRLDVSGFIVWPRNLSWREMTIDGKGLVLVRS